MEFVKKNKLQAKTKVATHGSFQGEAAAAVSVGRKRGDDGRTGVIAPTRAAVCLDAGGGTTVAGLGLIIWENAKVAAHGFFMRLRWWATGLAPQRPRWPEDDAALRTPLRRQRP